MRRAFQEFRDKSRVQRVARPVRRKPAQNRRSNQREVAEQVEGLGTDEFIGKAEGRVVEHSGLGKHDRIFERTTAYQTAGLQLLHFVIEAERACRRDAVRVIRSTKLHMKALPSDQRMREINVVLNGEGVRRVNAKSLSVLLQDEFFDDANVLPGLVQHHNANLFDRLRIRKGAAVQNGNLEIIEFDEGVVDTDAIESGQQMFDRRNPNATTHERRRI